MRERISLGSDTQRSRDACPFLNIVSLVILWRGLVLSNNTLKGQLLVNKDNKINKSHISRLIGSTVAVSYSVESAPGSGTRVSTKLSVANCDISEYLTAESTMVSYSYLISP